MCALRDALVIFFLTNDLFLSIDAFFKINYYINRYSNITKFHDNNNYYYTISKYYFIYYDNNIYNRLGPIVGSNHTPRLRGSTGIELYGWTPSRSVFICT
jgi:hypothetical protein